MEPLWVITFKNTKTISLFMVFFELSSRMREYYAFTKKEVRDLAIAIFIIGFIFSFREWGTSGGVDVLLGFRNFVLMLFITALSFFVHQSVHRIYALFIGFKAEFKLWWGGLIASLILAFATNGIVQLVLPGGMVASLLVRHRLGQLWSELLGEWFYCDGRATFKFGISIYCQDIFVCLSSQLVF
jgi:hypothetical protein